MGTPASPTQSPSAYDDPTPTPEFGLKEAIALKHAYVDQSHRFWTYFQLAAAAATGFAWQPRPPSHEILAGLAIGFLVFATANNRLVVDAQTAAYKVSAAIDKHLAARSTASPASDLLTVANIRKIDEPRLVLAMHVLLALVVTTLILIRTFAN